MKAEAEVGVTRLPAQGCPEPQEGAWPCGTLIVDFWLHSWERTSLCCSKLPSLWPPVGQPQDTGTGSEKLSTHPARATLR